LHIALKSLGISVGDEVIVPDITWVATARVVTYLGATPVFADIDKESWNIDISSIEKLITNKTKAIIPVHLYGNPANLVGLKKISLKYKISLVEDAAPALGSLYKGKMCGSVGHFSAFSFQGAKLLVAGEGGMLCTNSPRLYKIAKKISDHGRNPKKTFWIDGPGLKYKISNIQAAFASGQLERAKHLILMKRRIFDWYKEFLKNNSNISLLEENKDSYSNYWMVSIFLKNNKNKNRDKLIKFLRENNIDTRPVFSPISEYPIWNNKQKINKVSKLVGYSSLNLPSGTSLSKNEVRYICEKINLFFNLQG
jgi:perosamine synthetase